MNRALLLCLTLALGCGKTTQEQDKKPVEEATPSSTPSETHTPLPDGDPPSAAVLNPKRRLEGWDAVASLGQLLKKAQAATKKRRPLIVHFRALWAVPSVRMEDQVLKDKEVAKALADYSRVVIDVTDPNDQLDALSDALGVDGMPVVLLFANADALVQAIEKRNVIEPSLRLTKMPDSQGFLEILAKQ